MPSTHQDILHLQGQVIVFIIVHLHFDDGSLDESEEGGNVATCSGKVVTGHERQGQHHW